MGNKTRDVNDVTPGGDEQGILGFEKKAVSWDSSLEERSRFSELAEARPVVCGGGAARGGVRWKNQHRKKLCLSLLMSKKLKLKKVNKSFVPKPISCVFRIPICEWTLWTFYACVYLGRMFWTWTWMCYIWTEFDHGQLVNK